ncbi:MAG: hypothetical protein BWX92_02883 [Deltaproteobacteria bacterium ADurb.Bin135]|jgi:hypothetical protein|nr:MAG: hypothetical protein BWX92_02883 [Deltaproteobacteria bacterium ADurb.Bin135]
MKLEQLYQDYNELSSEEKLYFISQYRQRRSEDLRKEVVGKKGKKSNTVELTTAEKLLLKTLGITQKDLKALKAMQESLPEPEESEEDVAVLFDESNILLEDN